MLIDGGQYLAVIGHTGALYILDTDALGHHAPPAQPNNPNASAADAAPAAHQVTGRNPMKTLNRGQDWSRPEPVDLLAFAREIANQHFASQGERHPVLMCRGLLANSRKVFACLI